MSKKKTGRVSGVLAGRGEAAKKPGGAAGGVVMAGGSLRGGVRG